MAEVACHRPRPALDPPPVNNWAANQGGGNGRRPLWHLLGALTSTSAPAVPSDREKCDNHLHTHTHICIRIHTLSLCIHRQKTAHTHTHTPPPRGTGRTHTEDTVAQRDPGT